MGGWLDLAEAQAQLLALAPKMPREEVAVEDALGRVLADDLAARRTQPPADLSAMDGYAIAGNGPWQLVGESRAGAPFEGAIAHGEAVRISTGAHMPQGANSVLIQENATRDGDTLSAEQTPEPGRHVRRRGFDFGKGDQLLAQGTVLGPGQLALAIAGGHAVLPVAARPKVAVLDSGDELARDATNVRDDQMPASNGPMIAAMLAPLIGSAQRIGPVADDMGALAEALANAQDCDILITSGGASVGDHDLVQDALREWGCEIAFWKVAIKPGKPLMVATRAIGGRRQVVLGLPGNPVSSFVTAYLFALPLIRASLGIANPLPSPQQRIAGEVFPAGGPRREFVRAISDGEKVMSAASQDSSALGSLALANCLAEREPDGCEVAEGEPITVYTLQNGGFAWL
ncbi:molybdopterin molybdotransferase MoeA [Qipengyuania sp. S6317L1]|uniref:molybdopterin molybdotransferase MoeA n=1 Tax=Qipengyuania sp. S6317L1 TaxID=2926410 RepID=UPI001FF5ACAB|nr:molybdopterin molybdotransferase MoeA [Qipengyuania sp. S6317L1]MCK0099497.1 molybdopterin molybdotransferase MoeA [Qipengyuania sp. S6317L1]